MSDKKFTISGKEVTLKAPASFLMREALDIEFVRVVNDETLNLNQSVAAILLAASLGAYCPSVLPADLTFRAHGYNVISFGEAVYEHLRSEGANLVEIVNAGSEAVRLNRDSLAPRETEVAEAAKNS